MQRIIENHIYKYIIQVNNRGIYDVTFNWIW